MSSQSTAKLRRDDEADLAVARARPNGDTARKRACLSCSEMFESEGWHHRLCPKCRKRSD